MDFLKGFAGFAHWFLRLLLAAPSRIMRCQS